MKTLYFAALLLLFYINPLLCIAGALLLLVFVFLEVGSIQYKHKQSRRNH